MSSIKITRTYDTVTYESLEHGDTAESGILSEGEDIDFRSLVRMMEGGDPSTCPVDASIRTWVMYNADEDMYTGEREYNYVHFGDDPKNEWAVRFWCRALNYVFNRKNTTT